VRAALEEVRRERAQLLANRRCVAIQADVANPVLEAPAMDMSTAGVEKAKVERELELAKSLLSRKDARVKELELQVQELHEQKLESARPPSVRPPSVRPAASDAGTEAASDALAADREAEAQAARRDLQEELDATRSDLHLLQEAQRGLRDELSSAKQELVMAERKRLELVREMGSHGGGGGGGTAGMAAELDQEIRARMDLQDELERVTASFSMLVSRNKSLELALSSQGDGFQEAEIDRSGPEMSPVSPGRLRAAEHKEHSEVCSLIAQKMELREKVSVQKAQLQEMISENQVLHMSLEEMQGEVQSLMKQLRKYVPDIECMSADLEVVMNKMEKVAQNGGGAYVRLHKEARLREVAKTAKAEQRETEQQPQQPQIPRKEEIVFGGEPAMEAAVPSFSRRSSSKPPQSPKEPPAPTSPKLVQRERSSGLDLGALDAGGGAMLRLASPSKAAVGAHPSTGRVLMQRPSTQGATPSSQGGLPPLALDGARSANMRGPSPRRVEEKGLGLQEDKGQGSLAVGARGGMAVLGGASRKKMQAAPSGLPPSK